MIYEVEKLTFSYGKGQRRVLSDISLTVPEGSLITVLGKNGSGKSTLFGCLLGLLKPESGSVKLRGREVSGLTAREIALVVGYVPQTHIPTFAYSVFEFVLMGCASRTGFFSRPGKAEENKAEQALEKMGLTDLRDRPYTELSGGERQMVTIARALAAEPELILFDEPAAHLDAGNQLRMLRIIHELSEQGYGVIMTTHDPNHALLLGGTTVLFDGSGHAETGPTGQLLNEEALRNIYGEPLQLRYLEEFRREVCLFPNL